MTVLSDVSVAGLWERLAALEARVRAAVARRRVDDPAPDDPFKGLYLSDEQVDLLLVEDSRLLESQLVDSLVVPEPDGNGVGRSGESRLGRLASSFELDGLDVEILLVALAPDLDARFEPLYGYLHDDVTRRRASIGLALELCGRASGDGPARHRFHPDGRLVASGLLIVEEADRPYLSRSLRVPDRVAAHLLGDDTPDPLVAALLTDPVAAEVGDPRVLVRALEVGVGLVYLHERSGAAALSYTATALGQVGLPAVALDLGRVGADEDLAAVSAAAGREARLRGGALVAGPLDLLVEQHPRAPRHLAELACRTVLIGACGWDPDWSRTAPLVVEAPVPSVAERGAIWLACLNGALPRDDVVTATAAFQLTPEQVARAGRAAAQYAAAAGRGLQLADVQAGARTQNSAGLERLARRITPAATWDELILPGPVAAQLRELLARVRHRPTVQEAWRVGGSSSRGRGITALFTGESGTGKTMSAEVIAGQLGLDLYVIDLSTVVSKYIGETEKNLDRIFAEADRVSGVLLFDEADALFGKRSEVSDAHDRYANVETAYLLQRMERFDGLAILTTNLRANIDEAFTRRLDAIVDVPMPEEDDRRRLWTLYTGNGLPTGDDLDLDFLADAFELSGGNIRNIALTAAYLAADEDTPVSMTHLVRSTEREYRKLGRLCLEDEFGMYFDALRVP